MNTMEFGAQGEDVKWLQKELNNQLALDPPIAEDGDFGNKTKSAVIAFQSTGIGPDGTALHVDGKVGKLTLWALTANNQEQIGAKGIRYGKVRSELGFQTVVALEKEMTEGAREIGGNNQGRFVEKYLSPLGVATGAWCAGLTSYAVSVAAKKLGVPMPFKYSGTARGILRQLEDKNLGFDLDEEEPRCGDIMVWWRGSPDGWQGHIETVTDCKDGVIWTIGGNRGGFPSRVRPYSYVIEREKRLLGFAKLM